LFALQVAVGKDCGGGGDKRPAEHVQAVAEKQYCWTPSPEREPGMWSSHAKDLSSMSVVYGRLTSSKMSCWQEVRTLF